MHEDIGKRVKWKSTCCGEGVETEGTGILLAVDCYDAKNKHLVKSDTEGMYCARGCFRFDYRFPGKGMISAREQGVKEGETYCLWVHSYEIDSR